MMVPNSTIMRQFLSAASMHLEAAADLIRDREVTASVVYHAGIYLAGYSVECLLKARYLAEFKPIRHPAIVDRVFKKEIRHDLEELKKRLAGESVFLTTTQKRALNDAKSVWAADMRYRSEIVEYSTALTVLRAAKLMFVGLTS
jgi:hypothetical protein